MPSITSESNHADSRVSASSAVHDTSPRRARRRSTCCRRARYRLPPASSADRIGRQRLGAVHRARDEDARERDRRPRPPSARTRSARPRARRLRGRRVRAMRRRSSTGASHCSKRLPPNSACGHAEHARRHAPAPARIISGTVMTGGDSCRCSWRVMVGPALAVERHEDQAEHVERRQRRRRAGRAAHEDVVPAGEGLPEDLVLGEEPGEEAECRRSPASR